AAAFKSGLGKLPDELGKVTSSYQEAADGLNAFEMELASLKPAFQNIVSQLQAAHSQLANAQSSLSSAQSSLSTAQNKLNAQNISQPLTPFKSVPLSSALNTAVSAASGAVSNAQGEIASLTSQGFSILDAFGSARDSAQGKVSSASHVPPHRSWLDGALHWVGNVMNFILSPIEDLPGAIANFANHPSLSTFGKVAEDVGGTALLAATVLAPFAAPELVAADGAVDGSEAGVDGVAAATDEAGASAASKGLNLQQVVNGANGLAKGGGIVSGSANVIDDLEHGDYAEAELDAGLMLAPGAADTAGIGDEQVKEAESEVKAWGSLQDSIHELALPSDVQSSLDDLTNAGKTGAEQAATQAQYNADRGGQALDYGTEKGKSTLAKAVDPKIGVSHG
ncbi:MAG TPA: hypothetical protein VIJ20_03315, partial [Solirubrobacteraceae bacterium]